MSPRWANKRDQNDGEIFRALEFAGRNPLRGKDGDIYAEHVDGTGLILEVKTKDGRLRQYQRDLQAIFKDRYKVVRNVPEALAACGICSR